jgi:hypothetical protein
MTCSGVGRVVEERPLGWVSVRECPHLLLRRAESLGAWVLGLVPLPPPPPLGGLAALTWGLIRVLGGRSPQTVAKQSLGIAARLPAAGPTLEERRLTAACRTWWNADAPSNSAPRARSWRLYATRTAAARFCSSVDTPTATSKPTPSIAKEDCTSSAYGVGHSLMRLSQPRLSQPNCSLTGSLAFNRTVAFRRCVRPTHRGSVSSTATSVTGAVNHVELVGCARHLSPRSAVGSYRSVVIETEAD